MVDLRDFSYNELKKQFEICREEWMPSVLPPFTGDNPDEKIYSGRQPSKLIDFFSGRYLENVICRRVNCFDINFNHVHAAPENEKDYRKRLVILLEENKEFNENEMVNRPQYRTLYEKEISKISQLITFWKSDNYFKEQVEKLTQYLDDRREVSYFPKRGLLSEMEEICKKFLNNDEQEEEERQQKKGLIERIFTSYWTWVILLMIILVLFLINLFQKKKKKIISWI